MIAFFEKLEKDEINQVGLVFLLSTCLGFKIALFDCKSLLLNISPVSQSVSDAARNRLGVLSCHVHSNQSARELAI